MVSDSISNNVRPTKYKRLLLDTQREEFVKQEWDKKSGEDDVGRRLLQHLQDSLMPNVCTWRLELGTS